LKLILKKKCSHKSTFKVTLVVTTLFLLVSSNSLLWGTSKVKQNPEHRGKLYETRNSFIDVSPEEVKEALDTEDVFLLDVRNPDEYISGHIPGAYLIPVTELDDRKIELPANLSYPIIVYCRSGSRSVTASEKLVTHGYLEVRNMLGGFNSWIYASETGPFQTPTTFTNISSTESTSSDFIKSTGLPYWIFSGLLLIGIVIYRKRKNINDI
jgi:rhodanese-related sulfurtransferase